MGKSRPSPNGRNTQDKKGSKKRNLDRVLPARPGSKRSSMPKESVEDLLARAGALLEISQAEEALPIGLRALDQLRSEDADSTIRALPTLKLLGEIHLELGNADAARDFFLHAVDQDPRGLIPESQGGGVEKFLWIAQLSRDGGHDSVLWFRRSAIVLRNEIACTSDTEVQAQKKKKLAAALCGIIEIYMTDLSWESDAESRCESLITEAMLVTPESPETLQTLANVRISQERVEEARKALAESMELWKDLPAGADGIPEFPVRISLSRLLMEVEMEDEAIEVLERMVEEDDTSVEAWYLGGWGMYLLAERKKQTLEIAASRTRYDDAEDQASEASLRSSRVWLTNSLRRFDSQNYEDERLRDHAQELVKDLNLKLGDDNSEDHSDEEDGAEAEDWESDVEDEDQAMEGT